MVAPDETRPLLPPTGDATVAYRSAPSSVPSPATHDLRRLLRKRLLFTAVMMGIAFAAAWAGVPVDVEAVVLKLLAKEPAGRYVSAVEVGAALDGCAAAGSWTDADAAAWWASVEPARSAAPTADATVSAAGP